MNVQKISDQELIRLYQQGNEASLEILIKRHQRNVYTAIYLLVKNRSLTEDIFQETFIKIVNTLRSDKYNEEGKFAPWAARVARNLTIDYIRKMKRDVTITDSEGNNVFNYISIAEESNEDKIIRSQSEHYVRQLVKRLPEEQRQVLIMRQWGNMSFQE